MNFICGQVSCKRHLLFQLDGVGILLRGNNSGLSLCLMSVTCERVIGTDYLLVWYITKYNLRWPLESVPIFHERATVRRHCLAWTQTPSAVVTRYFCFTLLSVSSHQLYYMIFLFFHIVPNFCFPPVFFFNFFPPCIHPILVKQTNKPCIFAIVTFFISPKFYFLLSLCAQTRNSSEPETTKNVLLFLLAIESSQYLRQ